MEMGTCNKCGVGIGGERYCGNCMADICAERSGLNYQISDLRARLAAAEERAVREWAEWLDKKVNIEGITDKWPCFQHGADLYLTEKGRKE